MRAMLVARIFALLRSDFADLQGISPGRMRVRDQTDRFGPIKLHDS
jgi:hypothetical protein